MNIKKEYSNGEITIVWQPSLCSHSAMCFRNLPEVFDPRKRPWITPEGTDNERVIKQVEQCPSGALSYRKNHASTDSAETPAAVDTNDAHPLTEHFKTETTVKVINAGPLRVTGNIVIQHKDGREETKSVVSLCRCGHSKNKPFCDGAHKNITFDQD